MRKGDQLDDNIVIALFFLADLEFIPGFDSSYLLGVKYPTIPALNEEDRKIFTELNDQEIQDLDNVWTHFGKMDGINLWDYISHVDNAFDPELKKKITDRNLIKGILSDACTG